MENITQPASPRPVEQPKHNVKMHSGGNNLNWLLVTIALIIIVVLIFNNDRYGETKTADIPVTSFTKVHLQAGPGELILKQGDTASLTLTAPEKYHQWITTDVYDDELNIDADLPWFQRLFFVGPKKESITYSLTVTDLNTLTIDGFVEVRTETPIAQETFKLQINGAAEAQLELTLQELTVTLAGAGSIELQGTATKQTMTIDGAGEIDAAALQGKIVEATLNGAGSAEVFASESLTATLNGAGSIQYAGNPTNVKENINGVGSINPMNENDDEGNDTENTNVVNSNEEVDENDNTNTTNTNDTQ